MIQIDMEMPNSCSECEFATEPCGICAAKEMENSSKGIKSEDVCTVPYCNHRKPSEIGYGKPDWCPLKESEEIRKYGGNIISTFDLSTEGGKRFVYSKIAEQLISRGILVVDSYKLPEYAETTWCLKGVKQKDDSQ